MTVHSVGKAQVDIFLCFLFINMLSLRNATEHFWKVPFRGHFPLCECNCCNVLVSDNANCLAGISYTIWYDAISCWQYETFSLLSNSSSNISVRSSLQWLVKNEKCRWYETGLLLQWHRDRNEKTPRARYFREIWSKISYFKYYLLASK